jgi:rSAM/selenodomain-associated transferase 2
VAARSVTEPAALLSVILPVLNEAELIGPVLEPLQALRQQGHELILVDGGSADGTLARAAGLVDLVIHTPRGRATQMRAGAERARGDWMWFIHGDTRVSAAAVTALLRTLDDPRACWGRFDVRLDGEAWPLRVIERLINLRSRLSGIATGDQALFMRRDLYHRLGGWPDLPIMEDVAMSRALKTLARPRCLREPVHTSSRRWERHGVLPTVWLMWRLRLAFALGADPARLARRYAER